MIDPAQIAAMLSEEDRETLRKNLQELEASMAQAKTVTDKTKILRNYLDAAIQAQEAYERSKSAKVERPDTAEQPQE
jgi:pyrroloquinoline quinone (PQQ) biosynthesis protein C